jgi:hypothetical protein
MSQVKSQTICEQYRSYDLCKNVKDEDLCHAVDAFICNPAVQSAVDTVGAALMNSYVYVCANKQAVCNNVSDEKLCNDFMTDFCPSK